MQLPRLARMGRTRLDTRLSLALLLDERARRAPDDVLFLFGDRAYTNAAVKGRIDSIVRGLISHRRAPGRARRGADGHASLGARAGRRAEPARRGRGAAAARRRRAAAARASGRSARIITDAENAPKVAGVSPGCRCTCSAAAAASGRPAD